MKITIYWTTTNQEDIKRIREKFNLPKYTSINGETPCEVSDSDFPLLLEVEKRGFIQLRKKEV